MAFDCVEVALEGILGLLGLSRLVWEVSVLTVRCRWKLEACVKYETSIFILFDQKVQIGLL